MKLFGRSPSKTLLRYGGNGAVAAAPGSNCKQYATDVDGILNGAPLLARPETQIVAPFAGTIGNLYARVNAAFGAGVGVTFTIYVNEVSTGITCTIAGVGVVNAEDLVNRVAVAAGDRIYCHLDRSAGVPGAVTFGVSLELVAA